MLWLSLQFAKRYLLSKKSTNAINVISWVSVLGMMVGTAALIIILSVYNGFEDLVKSLYNTFNPDLEITVKAGKTFVPTAQMMQDLRAVEGVSAAALVLEENALLKYKNNSLIGRLKGVDTSFFDVTAIDTAIIDGDHQLVSSDVFLEVNDIHQTADYIHEKYFALLGIGVESKLGVNLLNQFAPLQIYMPRRLGKVSTLKPEQAFKKGNILPRGVFSIQQSFDSRYVIVPLPFMRKMLDYTNEVSAIEVAVLPNFLEPTGKLDFNLFGSSAYKRVQREVQAAVGSNFIVKNRYEQDEVLYKIMAAEKWVIYLILSFILLIAAFNIIGSLSMLVLEKQEDIGILKAMGATNNLVGRIFLTEGILLAVTGATAGMFIAVVLCILQTKFALLKLQGNSFLIEAYPVSMRLSDFVLVAATVIVIACLAAIFPARRAALLEN